MEQAPAKPALDFARCLNDAMDVYRKNVLAFVIAVILFDVLMLCSLFVLAGPLVGGMVLMCLNAMRDPEHKVRLGDLFGTFDRFGALVGFFFLTTIPILIGYAFLLVPGVILSAMWMFAPYLMIDRRMSVLDALQMSWRIVIARGFWINVAVAALITALMVGPLVFPYVGAIAAWFLAPLAWLINTSAYIQEVKEHSDLSEFAPRGFPIVPIAGVAMPAT